MYVFCSTDKGKTWSTNLVDGSFAGPKCPEWAKVRFSGVCPEQTVPCRSGPTCQSPFVSLSPACSATRTSF